MTITIQTLGQARYHPELVPDARIQTIPALSEGAALLELQQFRPLGVVTRLTNLALEQNASVRFHVEADEYNRPENTETVAMPSLETMPHMGYTALNRLRLTFANPGVGPVADYRFRFGVWIWKPSTAQKLGLGMSLTEDDKVLAEKYKLFSRVKAGPGLPFDIERIIRDEYKPWIHYNPVPMRVTQALLNTSTMFHQEVTRGQPVTDQFLVLTEIAAAPGTFGAGNENVQINITRDEDEDYCAVRTSPLNLGTTTCLPCWVPAIRKIEIRVQTDVAIAARAIRLVFAHMPMTDVHRIRWGLVSQDEVDRELWDQVKAGVV